VVTGRGAPLSAQRSTVTVASTPVDLIGQHEALDLLVSRAQDAAALPLAVVSINLDHIHHFGTGSRWLGTLDRPDTSVEWLNLIDGAPIVAAVRRQTGSSWPRLAGSDLIGPLLDRATTEGLSVGFFGGSPATHDLLRERMASERPDLTIAGYWAPSRDELSDPLRSAELAKSIEAAGVDILVVSLGKPRQELWISQHGAATGARVLLAFGAVVDFLAGRVDRAPAFVARVGMEWAWRLMLEPRRLAHRYLIDGPPAYRALRRPGAHPSARLSRSEVPSASSPARVPGVFASEGERADAAIVVVTYNNVDDVGPLIESLRDDAQTLSLRVIFVDNDSTDGTLDALAGYPDVTAVPSGGNLGYAAGINVGRSLLGDAGAMLVLNPDLTVERGAIGAMLARMRSSGAGIVVPRLAEESGEISPSLRREPTAGRALGDGLFGRRVSGRPAWLSEIDYDADSYRFAHQVEWATGAALLVDRQLADDLGDWDERFFLYSEEVDYFRRARELGASAWYESRARMTHRQGGSGASGALVALMTANRIRYAEKTGGRAAARRMRTALLLHEVLRSYQRTRRLSLRAVVSRRSWESLPGPSGHRERGKAAALSGSIVIPAHNEAAVIARTLRALAPLAESGGVEIVVSCNGCTDATAQIARTFAGVEVIELETPSKIAALNAADRRASSWPRLYLDADIEVTPGAIAEVFAALQGARVIAARPAFVYDTSGASGLVRSYYRARARIPSAHSALWGAGAYALSEAGHARFAEFPDVTADDLWIDQQFGSAEKCVVDTEPVVVRTPRNARALLAILRRANRGNRQVGSSTSGSSLRQVVASAKTPARVCDAVTYILFALLARRQDGRRPSSGAEGWERDESSRTAVPHE
jgi:exopolysaccharide biosynthesis WecB/TagA/CpsF family protein